MAICITGLIFLPDRVNRAYHPWRMLELTTAHVGAMLLYMYLLHGSAFLSQIMVVVSDYLRSRRNTTMRQKLVVFYNMISSEAHLRPRR